MAILQLFIIRNYGSWIIGLLRVHCVLLDIFDTGPDPTQPSQDGRILWSNPTQTDPTQPDPWMDQTHVQLCA